MNTGFKIAKAGYDIKTAGIENLVLDINYPLLKIKEIVSGSYNTSGDIVINIHDLGYIPQFKLFAQIQDGDIFPSGIDTDFVECPVSRVNTRSARGFPTAYFNYIPYADTTKLYLNINSFSAGSPLNYIAVIYYDPQV